MATQTGSQPKSAANDLSPFWPCYYIKCYKVCVSAGRAKFFLSFIWFFPSCSPRPLAVVAVPPVQSEQLFTIIAMPSNPPCPRSISEGLGTRPPRLAVLTDRKRSRNTCRAGGGVAAVGIAVRSQHSTSTVCVYFGRLVPAGGCSLGCTVINL